MGNWRTVAIRGSIAPEHVAAAREFVTAKDDYSNWHCLIASNGLAGLGNWVGEEVHADGNLAERGYSPEDVANTLRQMVQTVPSLALKVHCGGDYESEDVVATITVQGGVVTVGPAEIATVAGVDEERFKGRLFDALTRGPGDAS